MSGDRTWAMTLDIACSIETCPKIDTASCCDTTPIGATDGVKMLLRYRGWKINARDNTCPEHSGPIPPCPTCGVPTPLVYGQNHEWNPYKHPKNMCDPCYRKQHALDMAAWVMEHEAKS
jgi:hypothetical protein